MVQERSAVRRQGAMGRQHERAAARRAVGAGVRGGAAVGGDGEGDEDAAECERGEFV